MVKVLRLIIIIPAFISIAFSQTKKDSKNWNLRAQVHQINYYDVEENPESSSPYSKKKWLTGIAVFNREGNIRVRFEFSRNGKACHYDKSVFSYDAKSRQDSLMIFQSETGENICPSEPPVFEEQEAENLGGKLTLVEKKIYEYGFLGKISREIDYDSENKIVQQNTYEYNRHGESIRQMTLQEKYRVAGSSPGFVRVMDFQTSIRDKGKIRESYRYEDGKPVQREISFYDRKNRPVRSELYQLESDAQNKIAKEILGFRTQTFYDGGQELFSWTINDRSGELQTQLYILSEKDNELMRLEYDYRRQVMTNRDIAERGTHYQFENISPEVVGQLKYILKFDRYVDNPNWIPARFETRSYKFDAAGNMVQYKFQERDKLSKAIKDTLIREKEIIYYK